MQWIDFVQKRKLTWADGLVLVVLLVFMVTGIMTLPYFGMSWDEGLGNFFFGERYLHYLGSFNQNYLDFKAELPFHQDHPLNLFKSTWRNDPAAFPGLADIGSAAGMYLFSYALGWMDPVDAFHLFSIVLLTIFLGCFYLYFSNHLGKSPALLALLFLAAFPRLWGDMHFNQKDIPEMIFFGFALMAYWRWFQNPSTTWAILTGLATGAALGVKANALFLPVFMILGAWPLHPVEIWRHCRTYWLQYGVMIISAALLYYISWPYIYANPLTALDYFRAIMSQGGRSGSTQWNWQPIQITVATMPEVMLFCLVLGLGIAGWQVWKKQSFYRYILVWCLMPVLRISVPPSVNFDGIRHFLEFLPGAALLAGVGGSFLAEQVGRIRSGLKSPTQLAIAALILANLTLNFTNFGFYQYIYFNTLVGGLPGAAQYFGNSEATDYWAVSYRQGIHWLNENAPLDSALHVPVAGHLVDLTAPLWLRSDIQVIGEGLLPETRAQGKTIYVMLVTRDNFFNQVAEKCMYNLPPVYRIKIQGIPILHICQW